MTIPYFTAVLHPVRTSCKVLALVVLSLLAGCGAKEVAQNPEALEAIALLDLLDKEHQQQGSASFVELEIGQFRVSHNLPEMDGVLLVQFKLFGVLTESKKEQIEPNLPAIEKRVRDAVISVIQKAEIEQLSDPGMTFIKAELVTHLNRVMQGRILKSVVFSDFALVRR